MNSFKEKEKFSEIKNNAETLYLSLGEIFCPYFQEKVVFNAKGLEHLKFKNKNHARSQDDQFTRLKLFHLAPKVIGLTRTIQGISRTNNFEYMRSNARTELVMRNVSYYEFVAILEDKQENKRVRVVIKYFWSIIPFWKMDREKLNRKMHSRDLEIE